MKGGSFLKGTFSALKTNITGGGTQTKLEKEKQMMEEKLAQLGIKKNEDIQEHAEKEEVGEGYKEVIQYMEKKIREAKRGEDGGDKTDEDEDYDYGQECEEVFYQRKKQSTYFEDIHFRRDPKHGLVYTNTEYMQKQRGVLSHVLI